MSTADRIAYIDAQAGVAGDMVLGALVDLGFECSALEDLANALGLGPVKVTAERVRRGGITAVKVALDARQAPTPPRR